MLSKSGTNTSHPCTCTHRTQLNGCVHMVQARSRRVQKRESVGSALMKGQESAAPWAGPTQVGASGG